MLILTDAFSSFMMCGVYVISSSAILHAILYVISPHFTPTASLPLNLRSSKESKSLNILPVPYFTINFAVSHNSQDGACGQLQENSSACLKQGAKRCETYCAMVGNEYKHVKLNLYSFYL
uniref:ORF115 n=1 Tax=Malaco herpesvirus 1 TaxID=3031797 RepID=A0AA48P964_9VIRU|nr:TPA_asm: ORF115 [Malaco herpesvirus 1]